MKKTFLCLLSIVPFAYCLEATDAAFYASDEQIKNVLVRSFGYLDDVTAARHAFKTAVDYCGNDTNRLAKLLGELAGEKEGRVRRGVVRTLGQVGTKNELPILYSIMEIEDSSSIVGCSILRIEGLTDRTITTCDEYLNHSEHKARFHYEVCERLLEEMKKVDRESDLWKRSRAVVVDFMMNHNLFYEWVDEKMIEVEPGFEFSEERLAIMKSILKREKREHRLKYPKAVIEKFAAVCK